MKTPPSTPRMLLFEINLKSSTKILSRKWEWGLTLHQPHIKCRNILLPRLQSSYPKGWTGLTSVGRTVERYSARFLTGKRQVYALTTHLHKLQFDSIYPPKNGGCMLVVGRPPLPYSSPRLRRLVIPEREALAMALAAGPEHREMMPPVNVHPCRRPAAVEPVVVDHPMVAGGRPEVGTIHIALPHPNIRDLTFRTMVVVVAIMDRQDRLVHPVVAAAVDILRRSPLGGRYFGG